MNISKLVFDGYVSHFAPDGMAYDRYQEDVLEVAFYKALSLKSTSV